MAGYTRQSTFADGDTITAALFNNEYNQLVNAFSNTTGHAHDGTAANGPVIGLIGDAGETAPNNKVVIDTTNNYIEFYVEVSSSPVQQLYIADGAIIPVTDNDIDLGTSSLEFKDLYLDGTATIDTLTVDEAATIGTTLGVTGATTLSSTLGVTGATTLSSTLGVTGATTLSSTLAVTGTSTLTGNVTASNDLSVGGNLTVTGNATISGNLTFGDADTDSITLTADVASNIVPDTDDTYDLGTSTKQWRNLYIDGTAEVDTLSIDGTAVTSTAAELNILDGVTATAAEINTLDGITATVAELNILDGVTSTATELNIMDGDTTATATTLADADRVVVNDAGTMKQVALTDFETYFEGALDTLSNVTTVGALNAGSITSGFGAIDNGSSAITTTGTVTYGSLSDGTITITAFADEDDMVSNSATLVPTQQSVKAYVDSQVTAQDLDFQGDSGGALSIDLDSESLTIAGGTGIDTSGATNTLTVAIDSTVATLTDSQTLTNKTLTSPVLNTGVSGTAFLDDDTFATASATTLASSESIKAYVDAQILTEDTLAELNDTNITSPADGALLFYDTGTSMWIDNVVSGDISIADTGVAAISSGVIVNDDINASAAISVSKTALTAGTGLTLSTDTLSVDAAQTQITSVGTLSSLTVSGDLTVDTSTLVVDSTNNRVGILDATPEVSLDIGTATDAIHVPVGTTAQRPTAEAGMFRYNTTLSQFEGYTTEWGAIGGGGTNTFTRDEFTGDGSTVAFTLSQAIDDENDLIVFNGGVFQNQGAYSVLGTTLTFDTAPANGNTLIVYSVKVGVSGSNLNQDSFSGDGSTVAFTLSINPVNENNTQVFIDGVYQQKDAYSTSGTTLTFTAAPPNGSTVEVMTFTQTEINVPVDGTITPAKIASGDFYFDTDTLYIDSTNNRVGIGTSSPNTLLELSANNEGAANNTLRLTDTDTNVAGGQSIGALEFYGSDTSGAGAGVKAKVQAESVSNQGASYLYFTTSDTATNNQERMRIDEDGNVGIGTTDPQASLHVATSSSKIAEFERIGSQTFDLTISDVGDGVGQLWFNAQTNDTGFNFRPKNSSGTNTNALYINPDGDVGIGTTSPGFNLDITGEYGTSTAGLCIHNDSSAAVGNVALITFNTNNTFNGTDVQDITIGAVKTNSGNRESAFVVNTCVGTGTPTEKFRVAANGDVGIGTDSPDERLHVHTSDSGASLAAFTNSTSGLTTEFMVGINSYEQALLYNENNTDMIFATNDTIRMRIQSDGLIDIGPQSGSGVGRVNISANPSNNYQIEFWNTSSVSVGSITVSGGGTATAYNTSSDYRLKENVVYDWTALDRLNQLKPARFNFIASADTTVDGFLAHEVASVVPEAITGEKDAVDDEDNPIYQGIDQSKLVPLLVKAVQEQQEQIESLKSEIELLKGEK